MGEKIRTLRLNLGLTLEDVGKAVGVGKSTVRKWESGDIKNMRRDKIASLAAILQTTPAYLMGWDDAESALVKAGMSIDDIAFEMNIPVEIVKKIVTDNDLNDKTALQKVIRVAELLAAISERPNSSNIFPISKGSYVPLYGRIACGPPILAVDELEETAWLPEGVKADFALTACGDSMINARIFDGDIVYIRDVEVRNGDIAAVIVRDEEVTLKRFYYYPDEGRIVLRAENPTVRMQEYIGDELKHIRVLGKAVNFLSVVR